MKKVFVNGTFDILHTGHIKLLNFAKASGDVLHVAIDTDERVKEKKGASRPVFSQEERKFFLINLKAVDSVSFFSTDEELENTIQQYSPDIMIVGSDWKGKPVIGSQFAKELKFYDRIKITPPPTPFKVLLIGDSCIDEYVYGICSRLNPEAPVPVLDYTRTELKQGMAANVHENLKAFNINVEFITNKEKIVKTRYVDDKYNHQILRVDRHETLSPLIKASFDAGYDAIVISDYDKGFISKEKLFEIVETASCPVFIDTKKTTIPDKSNCFIKVNDVEFKNLLNPPKNVIATLGDKGARYQDKIYPTEKVTVFDVVGAGDTFLAALAYFYLLLGSIEKAIPFANKASAIVVQHIGTYVLTRDDVSTITAS